MGGGERSDLDLDPSKQIPTLSTTISVRTYALEHQELAELVRTSCHHVPPDARIHRPVLPRFLNVHLLMSTLPSHNPRQIAQSRNLRLTCPLEALRSGLGLSVLLQLRRTTTSSPADIESTGVLYLAVMLQEQEMDIIAPSSAGWTSLQRGKLHSPLSVCFFLYPLRLACSFPYYQAWHSVCMPGA